MPHYRIKVEPSADAITQAEFAKVIGVSAPTVNEFKRDGRLVMIYSGGRDKVLVKESIDKLNATMKMHGVFRNRQAIQDREEREKPIEELKTEVSATQLDLETQDADTLFKNSKALKEKAMALQMAAEHEKFMGNLIEREHVNRIFFERFRQFRDGLASLNRRLAPELAAINNIEEISRIIERDHRNILDNFEKLPIIE